MFAARASMKELAALSRQLGVALQAGVDVVRAFDLAARKGTGEMSRVLREVANQLRSGSDVTAALQSHSPWFPDLFLDMVHVGEQTGSLAEVLLALSRHYENNLRLRKSFVQQITFPVVQFVAAIFIMAALIFLLGIIASVDVLGFGLVGPSGALAWLGGWAMLAIAGYVVYRMLATSLSGKKLVHRLLLAIPVVGGCLRSFAVARFSWAFHLTQQAGMGIDPSLEASLRATGNGAFQAAAPDVIDDVNSGESLTEALEHTQLFPVDFIEMVHVAETSGTVPEALDHLSPQFEEDARRSLQTLAGAAGWVIWATVAGFIIFLIFRIAMKVWLGPLDEALREVNGL